MAIHTCPRCGELRAKFQNSLCSVCYLLDCLVEEHDAGEHDERTQPSCPSCRPRRDRALRDGEHGLYIKRMLVQPKPLTPKLAKFLLRLDQQGFIAAVRQGPVGSRAMIHLRDQGHLSIMWTKGCPWIRVSAQSRHNALDLLAQGQLPGDTHSERQGRTQTPVRTSHASCTHESTPAARAKCRAQRRG
jgi:hypothetical protein